MRKAFRTTIEEEILAELKKRAANSNCNVNDIIEHLAMKEFHSDYFTKHDAEFDAMPYIAKRQFLTRKLRKAIDDELSVFSLSSGFAPDNLIDILAETIAEIALSKLQYESKK